jgi:hypothetical protein
LRTSDTVTAEPTVGTSPVTAEPTVGINPVEAVVIPSGGGATGTEGISPPQATDERKHVRASAIAKRFIDVSPLDFEDAKVLTSRRIEQLPEVVARGWATQLISQTSTASSLTLTLKGMCSHEDILTEDAHDAPYGK